MFEPQESAPWYRSLTGLIAASVLIPPLGLAMLWTRRDIATSKKILGTLGIVLLGVGYVFLFAAWRRSSENEAVYDAVEQTSRSAGCQRGLPPVNQPAPANALNSRRTPRHQRLLDPPQSPAGAPETAAAHASRNYWTNFRGPNRDGRYDELQVLTQWPASGLVPMWKQPIGVGYASFVIADGRAHTIEQRRGQEVVTAYDVATGRELWKQGWNAQYSDSTGDGPRATPTWDDGRIYALGATGELRCLDAKTGAVAWGRNILTENQASNLSWAMAASPLVVDDKVIVLPGGANGKSIVAYNKLTGAPVWKSQNDTQAYVSPMLATLAGRRQIVVVSASRVMGLAPEDGSLLWSYVWDTGHGY